MHADAVDDSDAIGIQQISDLSEIGFKITRSHMFEHANRHDFIEMPGLLAIIPQREGEAVTICCCR